MNLVKNAGVNDPELALWLAQLIYSQYPSGGRNTWQECATELLSAAVPTFRWNPANGLNSGYGFLTDGVSDVAFIEGLGSIAQADAIANGYFQPSTEDHFEGANGQFAQQAGLILTQLSIYGAYTRPLTIVGHSYGGATAELMGVYLAQLRPLLPVRVISFAGPRPWRNGSYNAILANLNRVRWITDNDPIPHIPPHISELPLLMGLLSNNERSVLDAYLHVYPANILDAAGNLTFAANNGATFAGATADLIGCITGWIDVPSSTHEIFYLIDRLTLRVASNAVAAAQAPLPNPEVIEGRSHALDVAMQNAVADVRAQEALQNEFPFTIPDGQQFYASRAGGRTWVVNWQGYQIAVAPSKRRARGIARLGNDFLRRIQVAGQVDLSSLAMAFVNWLNNASDPLGTYVPVMATDNSRATVNNIQQVDD